MDARWLMAYSAGLGVTDARYYDTAKADGPLAHPLFAVCYEWPVSQPIRHIDALRPLFPLLVHAEHDLVIHRPPRAGDRLSTTARIVAVHGRKPGAYVVFRFDSVDQRGERVTSTDFGALYRGVGVEGASAGQITDIGKSEQALQPAGQIAIAANAAHVYTECARIFNPIHTDVAHAKAAGLPDIILHGTATLALSISLLLRKNSIDAQRVARVQCRFTGMVRMPSTLSVHAAAEVSSLAFETRGPSGESVIARGRIGLHR